MKPEFEAGSRLLCRKCKSKLGGVLGKDERVMVKCYNCNTAAFYDAGINDD